MRRIDTKFHIEGEEILASNGVAIPDDEPLFLLRARDHLALPLLKEYQRLCIADGCTDFQLNGIQAIIEVFTDFRNEHPERMKQPGITRGL
jgi:hypothetical protein